MRDIIECTILPNGDLLLTRKDSPEARQEWAERLEAVGEDSALWEALERYWTNGGFQPFNAEDGNPFVGLSSAPCIAECMDTDDDGQNSIVGRFWYYSDYMVCSYGLDLQRTGQTIFQLAR